MNATIYQANDGNEISYRIEFRPVRAAAQRKSNRPTFGRRRRNDPQLYNGIHRRRRKKIAW